MATAFKDMSPSEQRKFAFNSIFPGREEGDKLTFVQESRLKKKINNLKQKGLPEKTKTKAKRATDKGGREGAPGSKGFTPSKTNSGPDMSAVVKPDSETKTKTKTKPKPKPNVSKSTSSFGKTFADARSSGKKTFMWNGKSYNTKRADDKPKATPKKLEAMTGTESKSVKDLPPLTDKETKPGRNKALTEKLQKSTIDRAKNTTGINRPATAKEQRGRDQQKNARKSMGMKKGGMVKKCRMDGIALRGKTRAKERSK